MKYRLVGNSGLRVSEFALGTMTFGDDSGWGAAKFKDGRPADEAVHKTCFACHEPARARDFAFTRYAP